MRRLNLLLFSLFLLWGCSSRYHPISVSYTTHPVVGVQRTDSAISSYLQPLRDSLDKTMTVVLAQCVRRMDVRRPVSTLGNLMSDACLQMARAKFDAGADISVVRFGGIRRPYIDPGPVTRSIIFELMPFDNLMVLVEVNGATLKRFVEELGQEGAGIAGFTMTIANKKVSDILIGGKPIDPGGMYKVVYSDYNYNNSPELKEGKVKTTSYLIRDAIEDYVKQLSVKGISLGEQLENRINVSK